MSSSSFFLFPSSLFFKRLFFLGSLGFLSLSGLACGLQGPECRQDLDCPLSSVCVIGLCRPAGQIVCQRDGSCPQGTRCSQGTCEPSGATCKTNAECPSTEECRVLVCQPKTPVTCTKDADCPAKQTCKNKTCTPVTPACTKDADCPASQTCKNKTCTPVTPACTKDTDCETGYRCIEGKCSPTASNCTEDKDCLAGQICLVRTCQAASACLPSKVAYTVSTVFPAQVTDLFFLQGGKEILDVNETSLRLRSAATGEWKRWWIFVKDGSIPLLALSPSGRWFARSTAELKLWDLTSESPPQKKAVQIAALHLGEQAITTLEKGRLARYSTLDLQLQKEIPFPQDLTTKGFYSQSFHPDGSRFAFFTPDQTKGTMTVVESETMKILHTFPIPEELRFYFAYKTGFSPQGRYLWASGSQGFLLWDLQQASPQPIRLAASMSGGPAAPQRFAFHPQDTHFAFLLTDGTIQVLQLPDGSEVKKFLTSPETMLLRYAPDGQSLFYVTKNNSIQGVSLEGKYTFASEPKLQPISMASVLDQGDRVRSSTEDGIIREWDLSTQDFRVWIVPSDGKQTKYRSVLLSPDGRIALDLFSKETSPGKSTEVVEQWEIEPTFRKLRDLHQGPIYWPHTFSPESRFLAAPLPERKIGIWDLHTGQVLPSLDAASILPSPNSDSIYSLAVSPGASYVAAASNGGGKAALWDRRDGSIHPLHGGQGTRFRNLVFAPDGETFAALVEYDRVEIFSSKTRAIQRSIPIRSSNYARLAFSPDGNFLAGSNDSSGAISLWEVKTGKLFLTYSLGKDTTGRPLSAYHVFFASSGRRFLFAPPGEFSAWDCP